MDNKTGDISLFMEKVLIGDASYLYSLSEELGRRGFETAVVDSRLRKVFTDWMTNKLSDEERLETWAKLVNLKEEDAGVLVEFTEKIEPIVSELADLDKKWQGFMSEKAVA